MIHPNARPIAAAAAHRSAAGSILGRTISGRSAVLLLGSLTLIAILLGVTPHGVYIRSYLQDTFGLLDGVHRMVLGQVPHRDFSTAVGVAVFALPSLFAGLGADLVNSLTYTASLLLLLNFLVICQLLHTRLSAAQALLFGSLTTLTLASRFVFGEDPQLVTLGMGYNRYCTAFISALVLFFIPPRHDNTTTMVIDSLIIGMIVALLFYSKITFGLCALAVVAILFLVSEANRGRTSLALGYFVALAAVLELTLGFHAALAGDILMALRSSGVTRATILYEVVANFPELLICALLPAGVLLMTRALTVRLGLVFCAVIVMSLMLLNQSAQLRTMIIPFALLIVAWRIIDARPLAGDGFTRLLSLSPRQVLVAAAGFMWVFYCYPMVVNLGLSFSRSVLGQPIDRTAAVLDEIKAERVRDAVPIVQELMQEGPDAVDVYERTIHAAGIPLNGADYVTSIIDGLAAARSGCGLQAGVLTADFVNPFPALLNSPVGGGAIYFDSELLMSERAHIPEEKMFSGINCVMVPKLPVAYSSWHLFLKIYQDYLRLHFATAGQTAYWTVLRRIPAQK